MMFNLLTLSAKYDRFKTKEIKMITYNDLFAEKYRPKTLNDMVLTPDVRTFFEEIFSKPEPTIPNLLFRGRPGGGKTTLARIIADKLGWEKLELNASSENGIDTIRGKVIGFSETMSLNGKMKLVLFEEADGLSSGSGTGSSAQQMLKNLIEDSSDRVRYIMTVNDVSKIDAPIKSRMQEFLIRPPDPSESKDILKLLATIMKKEDIKLGDADDLNRLIAKYYPDIRKMLNVLQQQSNNTDRKLVPDSGTTLVGEKVAKAVLKKVLGTNISDSDLMLIRQKVMDNEKMFDGNYHNLLKSMFEIVAKEPVAGTSAVEAKREAMLSIYEAMYRHQDAIDKEVNAFALFVRLAMINGGFVIA